MSKITIINITLLVLFLIIIGLIFSNHPLLMSLDLSVQRFSASLVNDNITGIMIAISKIFDVAPMIIVCLIIFFILIGKKEYKNTFMFCISVLGALLTETLIKNIIMKPRPLSTIIVEDSYSFPSAHATMAVVFFSMMILIFRKRIRSNNLRIGFTALNAFLIVLICFDRLYLNVHWFSDVIGGLILGFFWITLSIMITKKSKTV